MKPDPVELFVRPRSVALIGASRNEESITARSARYLRDYAYPGTVTIVKAGAAGQLHGFSTVASIREIDPAPDVAMVMVPAAGVPQALQEAGEAGVAGAVVISSGFEGEHGLPLRREVEAVVADHPDLRVIGPNCVGVLSPVEKTWLTFSSVLLNEDLYEGHIGLVTQSGAVGNGLLNALQQRGVGVAHWFSTGDEVDVGALEIAGGLLHRSECRVVGLFLEGVTDPGHREELARAIEQTGKPVIALRAAASEQGKSAAMGHTGRVVGDHEIATAALEEVGVHLVRSLDELLETLTLFSVAPTAPREVPAPVAVVTVSGATGVMAADEIARHPQLSFTSFTDEDRQRIASATGTLSASEVQNPLDVPVLGDPQVFQRAISATSASTGTAATLAIVSSLAHDYEQLSENLTSDSGFTVLTHLSPTERFERDQARRLVLRGVAPLQSPQRAVRALQLWARYGKSDNAPAAPPSEDRPAPAHLGFTGSLERFPDLKHWAAPAHVVRSAEESVNALRDADHGIVLKADGQTITHRAELQALAVGLTDAAETAREYARIAAVCQHHGDQVIAQPMAGAGVEVMVSIMRDPEVGVAAVLRLGGSYVELGTESVVLTSLRKYWTGRLQHSTLGNVLAGWRGGTAADIHALLDLTAGLMTVASKNAEIVLIECNPVIVHEPGDATGATIVDLVTYLSDAEGTT